MVKLPAAFVLIALISLELIPLGAYALFEYSKVETVTVYAPAVSSGGQGVLSKITLAIAYPGNGRVFFSALPYTEVETQGAARLAAYIASLVAKTEFSRYDYFVLVESDVPLIGGPSAGGLMAVGFIALLTGSKLNPDVTMTGMLNPDGSVGPVGGLKEKLEAAASNGFKVFLIPAGQRVYSYPVYEEYRRGPFIFRRVTYASVDLVEYGRELGVEVVEVYTVGEAVQYFTGLNVAREEVTVPGNYSEGLLTASREFYGELSSEVKALISELAKSAQGLGGYYGRLYQQVAASLNQSITELDRLAPNYPVYASYALPGVYKNAVKYYWSLQLQLGALGVEQLLNDVLQSINDAATIVSGGSCTLESGLAQALLYNAWTYYSAATNTSDTPSQLEYASEALRLVKLAKLHYELSTLGQTPLDCSAGKLVEAYSNALGVYTYVSRLVEEAGVQVAYLDRASRYVEALSYGYEYKSPMLYGAGVVLLGYSALSVHVAFGTVSNALSARYKLTGLYAGGHGSPLMAYYLRLLEDSLSLGDTDSASLALSLTIATLQVESTNPLSTGLVEGVSAPGTPSPTSTPGVNANTNTPVPTTPGHQGGVESQQWGLLLYAVVLVIAALAVYAITRLAKPRS